MGSGSGCEDGHSFDPNAGILNDKTGEYKQISTCFENNGSYTNVHRRPAEDACIV